MRLCGCGAEAPRPLWEAQNLPVEDVGPGERMGEGAGSRKSIPRKMRSWRRMPENGIARTPDGGEGAWFKDSEGNLLGLVRALPSKFSERARRRDSRHVRRGPSVGIHGVYHRD